MSRSGYSEDCEYMELYRGNVERALHGKRGQTFLTELASALDAMPEKSLIADQLIDEQGRCCAIGAVCKAKSLDVSDIDYEDSESVAKMIGVAPCMAAEIAFMNDEAFSAIETPEHRWTRIRKWVTENIAP